MIGGKAQFIAGRDNLPPEAAVFRAGGLIGRSAIAGAPQRHSGTAKADVAHSLLD